MLAEAHLEMGDIDKAEREIADAEARMSRSNAPAAAQLLYDRALLALEKGEKDDARRLAAKVGEAGSGRWKARSAALLARLDQKT